jgi:hypothetical protein
VRVDVGQALVDRTDAVSILRRLGLGKQGVALGVG